MLVSNAIRYENIRTFPIDVKVSRKLRKESVVLLASLFFWGKRLFVLYGDCHEAPSILLREKKKFLSLFARKSVQNILFFVQKIKKRRDIFKTISPRFQLKNKYFIFVLGK
jgi:hypothetical protein